MSDRRIRRSQILSPFGVGAMFDVVGESFVAEDITRWQGKQVSVSAPRIAALMGVATLRTAPVAPERGSSGSGVPFYRFPQWMFCPGHDCRRMSRWSLIKERGLEPGSPPRCDQCKGRRQLVPMRFVVVCGNGHLDDVDWVSWAHSTASEPGQERCRDRDHLRFDVRSERGGGLDSLVVRCSTCKSERSLTAITSPEMPRRLGWRCRGRQPWFRPDESEDCDVNNEGDGGRIHGPVVVQRGASNVHFPEVASVIDIPPDSDFDQYGGDAMRIRGNSNFRHLEESPQHPLRDSLIDLVCAEEGVDRLVVEGLLQAVLGEDAAQPAPPGVDFSGEQVRRDEWHALSRPRDRVADPRDRFVVEHMDLSQLSSSGPSQGSAKLLTSKLEGLVKVTRLREVRVLRGFRRYTLKRLVPSDLGKGAKWLPSVEVFGEGVFISLDESRVAEWEGRAGVMERVKLLEERRLASVFSRLLPPATPRLVMLHTLAHLLIRQLVHESGYSGSSLRERLYIAGPTDPTAMAGLLIYTGAGDSEGTLGGLVRVGEPAAFVPIAISALRRAEWCSLDPVCRETTAQGLDGLSLAGCHACALLAETSCECSNSLLDRSLVVDSDLGFFGDVVALAGNEAAETVL